jgi:hypothetical protein
MSDDRIDRDPPRLKREAGHMANLLQQAEAEFRDDLDEARAFQRVESVRRRRAIRTFSAWTALITVVSVAVLVRHRDARTPSRFDMQAEAPRKSNGLTHVEKSATTASSLPLSLEGPPAVVRTVPSSSSPAATPPPTEAECRRWAMSGKNERAQDCFRALARTASGVEAEVALYEAARLAAEPLHEPARALALLEEHATRFPASALRGEVAWLRIRSLAQVKRFDAALQESETLMGSPEGRALTRELHLLRGRIYQDEQKNCDRALSEFLGLVGAPGAAGDDAEFRRASCLEALGRVEDAVAAYTRYLERTEVARATEARARLAALRP